MESGRATAQALSPTAGDCSQAPTCFPYEPPFPIYFFLQGTADVKDSTTCLYFTDHLPICTGFKIKTKKEQTGNLRTGLKTLQLVLKNQEN